MKIIKCLLLIVILFSTTTFFAQGKATVVVAANLKTAMDSIAKDYKQRNPADNIQISYGASGKFYEQIVNGAPFDVFFSADMNYPTKLKESHFGISTVKLYAIGRIAIWSKKIDPNTQKMNSLLDPKVKKISIANPVTAPYGAKAVESMKRTKIYNKVKSNLVYGENIAQAAQFVAFGAADIGIIALSDVLSPAMKKERGKYYVIPQENHAPLEQGCVVLKHAKGNATALRFYDYISSDKAVAILKYYGYSQK
ncbi:molybdate ABC transporter substrate-binding protein [Flavobacterium undicola]|uniref:molybdate ABC transporter substrate-binding protein n=1 Tax=Flavobacterium undicola TaxID=1932779 RepID=UPI0015E21830|nr:molybdate ABC transporter substrate-binding protein [Flavobacterium undicola]MBA0882653.1 molybdate ABC transporter substrate-binding protein [Flavobacterium undicola]